MREDALDFVGGEAAGDGLVGDLLEVGFDAAGYGGDFIAFLLEFAGYGQADVGAGAEDEYDWFGHCDPGIKAARYYPVRLRDKVEVGIFQEGDESLFKPEASSN